MSDFDSNPFADPEAGNPFAVSIQYTSTFTRKHPRLADRLKFTITCQSQDCMIHSFLPATNNEPIHTGVINSLCL